MSKKNRAKSKAKRFGEGSAKPIVSAATYGVGGNAFAQAIADPVSTVHSNKPELLVVDGYNVIHCTPRYEKLVYDHSDDPYSSDVHEAEEAPQIKMTLGSRLSPDALAKLKALRGR